METETVAYRDGGGDLHDSSRAAPIVRIIVMYLGQKKEGVKMLLSKTTTNRRSHVCAFFYSRLPPLPQNTAICTRSRGTFSIPDI